MSEALRDVEEELAENEEGGELDVGTDELTSCRIGTVKRILSLLLVQAKRVGRGVSCYRLHSLPLASVLIRDGVALFFSSQFFTLLVIPTRLVLAVAPCRHDWVKCLFHFFPLEFPPSPSSSLELSSGWA